MLEWKRLTKWRVCYAWQSDGAAPHTKCNTARHFIITLFTYTVYHILNEETVTKCDHNCTFHSPFSPYPPSLLPETLPIFFGIIHNEVCG